MFNSNETLDAVRRFMLLAAVPHFEAQPGIKPWDRPISPSDYRVRYKFGYVADPYECNYLLLLHSDFAGEWTFNVSAFTNSLGTVETVPELISVDREQLFICINDNEFFKRLNWHIFTSKSAFDSVGLTSQKLLRWPAESALKLYYKRYYYARQSDWRQIVANHAAAKVDHTVLRELMHKTIYHKDCGELAARVKAFELLARQVGLQCNTDSLDFENVPKRGLLIFLLSLLQRQSEGLVTSIEVPKCYQNFLELCT